MCGISGTAGFGSSSALRRMAEAIAHRGPDEEGYYEDPERQVFLASRRLSILDVEGGRQPVYSEDRRVVAVHNGEIYNFRELRRELEARGHTVRGRGDSEVIPHLYEEYGESFPLHLDGMFAIALWDLDAGKLLLCRDHVGIKPLHLWRRGSRLAFASEVKALLALDGLEAALDLRSLHFLLNIRFIPGRSTLFRDIRRLEPGSLIVWQDGELRERRFWRLEVEPDPSIRRPEECVERTRELLERAVRKQLVSDVPLGLYLSGGIDSSTLVAMASRAAAGVETYTLGFDEPTDELVDARAVAEAFGTRHHEAVIDFDALSVFPQVTWAVEEPKENAIQLYLLSRYASRHVKVALSGLGGDELFGGYRIFDYLRPTVAWQRILGRRFHQHLLRPVGSLLAAIAGSLGSMRWDLARRGLDYAFSIGLPVRSYLLLRNMWEHDRRLFRAIYAPAAQASIERGVEEFFAPLFERPHADVREDVLRTEFAYKMVDDFLLNEDRTSMANSLEVRVPFLDLELVEFAFSIPAAVKFGNGELKTVLKRAMRGILPPPTLAKPKWGFTFDAYLQFRKDLRELGRRELGEEFLAEQGIFNPRFVRAVLDHPPHPAMRWHYFLLWLILGVKVWQRLFIEGRAPEDCYER